MKKVIAALIGAAALTGCSAFTKGQYQSLTVTTTPSKAWCTVSHPGETAFETLVSDGTIYNVRRGHKEINVLCSKEGYYDSQAILVPETDTESYQSFVIPDMLLGTNMDYPEEVHIDLRKI